MADRFQQKFEQLQLCLSSKDNGAVPLTGRDKVVCFVDRSTASIRLLAIKRVQQAGIFTVGKDHRLKTKA